MSRPALLIEVFAEGALVGTFTVIGRQRIKRALRRAQRDERKSHLSDQARRRNLKLIEDGVNYPEEWFLSAHHAELSRQAGRLQETLQAA